MFLSVDHALLLIIFNPYLHLGRGSRFHTHIKEVRYYYYTILIFIYFGWRPEGTDTEVSGGKHFPNCPLVLYAPSICYCRYQICEPIANFKAWICLLQDTKFQYSAEANPLFWPEFCGWNTNVNSVPLRFLLEYILSKMRIQNEVHRIVDRTMSKNILLFLPLLSPSTPLSYFTQPKGRVAREVCNAIQTTRKHFCDHNRWTTSRGRVGLVWKF